VTNQIDAADAERAAELRRASDTLMLEASPEVEHLRGEYRRMTAPLPPEPAG
jgi:hypothetical protein